MKKIAKFLMAASIFAAIIVGVIGDALWWIPVFATISTPGIVLSQENAWDKAGRKTALILGSFLVGLVSYALFFGLGWGISLLMG